jgi:hypothetical protein
MPGMHQASVTGLLAFINTNVHHELGATIGVAGASSNLDQFEKRMLDTSSVSFTSNFTSWLGR